jgi:hypothetical protein
VVGYNQPPAAPPAPPRPHEVGKPRGPLPPLLAQLTQLMKTPRGVALAVILREVLDRPRWQG